MGLWDVKYPTLIRLTDDGKFVSPSHLPRSTPQKHYFSASGTHFCKTLKKTQDLMRPEGLDKLKKNRSPHRVPNPQPSSL
jgi:hypothetical protein